MRPLRDGLLQALADLAKAGEARELVRYDWRCCDAARRPAHAPLGPAGCTCWEPVYDLDQRNPTPEVVAAVVLGRREIDIRDRMCVDCAYRPGSPERSGDPRYQGTPELLEDAAARARFFCHASEDGVAMRRLVGWRHPGGMTLTVSGDDYQPPIVDRVPYLSDGTPAPLCAGWAAVGRRLLRDQAREDTTPGTCQTARESEPEPMPVNAATGPGASR